MTASIGRHIPWPPLRRGVDEEVGVPGTVGIVGFGTMGAGIAQVCLEAGHRVIARDVSDDLLEAGRSRIGSGIARRVAKGQLAADAADEAVGRLETALELQALAPADVVIEAIVEQLDAKRALLAALDDVVRPDTILATNTSAISVTSIAMASARPERVVGMHFFNPAPLMKLVEVVHTDLVDDDRFAAALEFARGLGKEAVACPDTPGFLVNRLLIPLLNDAVRAHEETGVPIEDIDRAMQHGAGWPMGPFALADMIGLDVHVHAAEALWESSREERMAPPARLVRMVRAGFLGRKTGRGFFRYG
jgi:3-hydroxybutyryl-CoA dehydrogenase